MANSNKFVFVVLILKNIMSFPSELSTVLEEKISTYYNDLNIEEVGTVLSIADGVARVYGLQNVQAGEDRKSVV